jgi:hypothetical protein
MDKGYPAIGYPIFGFPMPCLPCDICGIGDIKVINHKLKGDGKKWLG